MDIESDSGDDQFDEDLPGEQSSDEDPYEPYVWAEHEVPDRDWYRREFREWRFSFSVDAQGQLQRDHVAGDLLLTIHLAPVRGRLMCVGADLRTFITRRGKNVESVRWRHFKQVDASTWRQIPLGAMIDEAFEQERKSIEALERPYRPDSQTAWGKQWIAEQKALLDRAKPKPGPKSSLTPEVLQQVAEAYATGGRKPVQAVRQALEEAGFAGAGPRSDVTIDQARKAVMKARQVGLIPPARRKGDGS